MLEGLDKINWPNLTHAYGSAADVPRLLRDLQSAPRNKGGDGPLWELFGNIWHQGTVYEATVPAVPFLVELAAHPDTRDRPGVLMLLASIADGDGGRWTKPANEAVAAGEAALLPLTYDAVDDVRLGAAHVLAHLPTTAPRTGPLLRSMVGTEAPGLHRAGLLLLLGFLGDPAEATLELLASSFANPVEQMAADLSLGRLNPERLSPSSLVRLTEAADGLDVEARKLFDGLPWDVGDGGLEEVVDALGTAVAARRIDGLLATVEAGKADRRTVGQLLGLSFPSTRKRLIPADLSVAQRRILRAVVAAGVSPDTVRMNSLPHTMDGLRSLSIDPQRI